MKDKGLWIAVLFPATVTIVVLLVTRRPIDAQARVQQGDKGQAPSVYNPYPPGILPSNLSSELARVLRETDVIEDRALARWHALPPATLTGQPPVLQNSGTEAIETLGELMLFDKNISPNRNEACASCHMPYAGLSGPIPSVNLTMIAYPGTARFRAAKRTAQRYPYAPFFPALQYNQVQGLFFGGNFWDSRATGYKLRIPDAEQAQGPPVDHMEMGFPDTACIAFRLSAAGYRPLFDEVWGQGSLDIQFPRQTEKICDTPGGAAVFKGSTTPVLLSSGDRTRANTVYDHWAQSIDSYEQSVQISAFSSKFDAFLAGKYKLAPDEMAGYKLFNGKGNCNSCHLDGRGTTLKAAQADTSATAMVNPLFTCFGSANEGTPLNPRVTFYYETKPDSYGFTPNPYGFGYRDLGLGTFLRSGFGSGPSPNSSWRQYAPTVDGQMQVPTLRNVALTPSQCPTTEAPGPYFQKEFFHNGYLKSLKQVVHFYNTRDKYAYPVTSGHCPAGTTEKVDCWPMPEVPNNIDMTSGNLGLTDKEENQIVAFLQTLSDGFTRPYPNADTYTGACMRGGSAATQGNQLLIPTPPLPPCASAICGVAPVPGPKPISDNPRTHQSSTAPKVARLRIIHVPTIELATEQLTVIRWTTDNPGGSPVHYGIVHYGTDAADLSRTAKSPIRLNMDHPYTVFRVRMDGLKPETTYYYTVDSMEANGNDDGVKCSVKHFTSP
ncbi:MAG: cytochrome c peroxidase [Acidobacteriaceae bacterium]